MKINWDFLIFLACLPLVWLLICLGVLFLRIHHLGN